MRKPLFVQRARRRRGTLKERHCGRAAASAMCLRQQTGRQCTTTTPPLRAAAGGRARRAFRKVKAQDLAGIWCGCKMCPFIPLWPLSFFPCTKITALDEDNYRTVESGCCLCLPMPPVHSEYRRIYVNGHPTNAFDGYDWQGQPVTNWHRDPGCAAADPVPTLRPLFFCTFFAKKVG